MQKPIAVIDAQRDFLTQSYANAGRGICARAAAVDESVAHARNAVARFINAAPHQIVFTSGATDGLNRVVDIIGNARCVAVSDLEHHSARLPWVGVQTVQMPLDEHYNYDVKNIPYADVVVITAMSNVLGVPQDVAAIVRAAREKNPNVITVVDAAQYVAHDKIDVKEWDCDFLCFSGHKIGADTGVGVMYIKEPDRWAPDKLGGGMVARVDGNTFVTEPAPYKFEAGTLPLTQIIGLPYAIEYIKSHRPDLAQIKYLYDALVTNPRIKILTARDAALLSFITDDMAAIDFGALVGARGICLRVGNMCASWIHNRMGLRGSIRISVGPQNTNDEIEQAANIIKGIVR